ncbi:MAG TPA: hypothetical protein VLB85_02445 [Acidimicrobiia bacterium]|nr:hypothetical protein [Acidimicrobiia bacterium]
MTRQESFKHRIRARMEKTGERYSAARRHLISAGEGRHREWVSAPEVADDTVREETGRTWNEWCDLLEASPVAGADHGAIASYLADEVGVDGWWAQTVTLGFERITGRRLPHQRPDGTFTLSKSKTLDLDPEELKALLLDEDAHADLFPGLDTEIRSRPRSRNPRIALGGGSALFSIDPAGEGRVRLTVSHERLADPEDVERWRYYWGEWLDALAE